jgi:hypothetical protein
MLVHRNSLLATLHGDEYVFTLLKLFIVSCAPSL